MPKFARTIPPYKASKDVSIDWNTFRRGLNILLNPTEIGKDELAQADNIILIGKGVPTKRWGRALFYQAGNATGSVRGLRGFYPSGASGTVELLAITDDGYLTKKSSASYSTLTGSSWASGNAAYMEQLDNKMYIVSGQRELVRYSSPTLVGFATIASPVIQGASNISNATGTTLKSYRITALSEVGETLASSALELKSQPLDLGGTHGGVIRLQWTGVSTASGILTGFNIYGRDSGNERFLAFSSPEATTYFDDGTSIPRDFTFPPNADSTGGPKCRYVKRFKDRLVFAGFDDEPSKLLISGRVPNQEKFDYANGGALLYLEPDAGDRIIQIESFRDRIIVFKERSIWQVTLFQIQIGNFYVIEPLPELITGAFGCIAPRSVVPVGNDIFFLSRRGVQSLGHESGFAFDVLRTNEVSIRIRPYFRDLTVGQLQDAVATYDDFEDKYIISFPTKTETMVFDRERLAWTGPWNFDSTAYEVFYDTGNMKKLLMAAQGGVDVDELSDDYTTDKGTAIATTVKTRSEDFGNWAIFKNIRNLFTQLQNVTGTVSVDIRIETRAGAITTTKSFNITPASGNSGWGADQWGVALWADSEESAGGVDAVFTIRWANLNKIGRTMQLTFKTTVATANYELLGILADAKPLGRGFNPASWRV